MALFTTENAALFGSKGGKIAADSKAAAKLKRMEDVALARKIAEAEPTYLDKTLARVRLQLDQLFELFVGETDPAKLDRLAAAQARLSEQERQLAGRPLPGSLRPQSTKSKANHSLPAPQPLDEPDTSPPPT